MIATAALPVEGLWRVARGGPEGIRFQAADRVDDDNPRGGNRFDSFTGSYGTLYFGASLEVCYAETLGRLRPKQSLALLAAGDWDEMHVMLPGNIAADWRLRRTAVRARPTSHPFVNITHPDTLAELNQHPTLMAGLAHYGIDDLDLSDVTGKDRRVTRFIAKYLHDLQDNDGEPAWGGVRGRYPTTARSRCSSASRSPRTTRTCLPSPIDSASRSTRSLQGRRCGAPADPGGQRLPIRAGWRAEADQHPV
jgi:hypothetical protein